MFKGTKSEWFATLIVFFFSVFLLLGVTSLDMAVVASISYVAAFAAYFAEKKYERK
ncbi:hypothetical protein [Corynebacterium phocae]|uniref:hypothetical protein n=1 Tax=Corynebacterium phocae TaxID=161895 RepID=UPI0012EE8DB8|nr:hypothetical protein [Corynebacterium phocae]